MIWFVSTLGCLVIFLLSMSSGQRWIAKLLTLLLMAGLLFGYQWALYATRWYDYHQFLQSSSADKASAQLKYALMKNHLLKMYRQAPKDEYLVKLVPICRQLKDYACVKQKLVLLLQHAIKPQHYALRLVEAEYHLGAERPSPQLEKALAVCDHHPEDRLECQSFAARAYYNNQDFKKSAALWQNILKLADEDDPRREIWHKAYASRKNAGASPTQ